ncbi:alcohol dehydrogenase-like protein [Rhexocercosporidium sp. MPI-PUGE-AT-0058]|nr:alcohol dehydrogenase-like protein [Rhexocercosporidium sp. MPI-PUGE-AT-0058]
MQALQLNRPDPSQHPLLTLESLPKPDIKAGHILISLHASAIHPSDLLNSTGSFPLTTYPRIPGRDFSGLVISPPSHPLYNKPVFGTSGNTLGFTVSGAHAQFILVPEGAVVEKPEALSWVQAATLGVPFSTAALVLKRAGLVEGSGESVLVLGANGAVGSAVVQLAEARGARVLKGMRSDSGDVNTASDPELTKLDELTKGAGVDIVIDTVGQPALTAAACRKIAKGGRVVFIAAPRGGEATLGVEMTGFYRKEGSLLGVNSLLYGVEEMAGLLEGMVGLFEEGKLKGAEEGTWNEVPFEDSIGAYKMAAEKGKGKFVLVMQ